MDCVEANMQMQMQMQMQEQVCAREISNVLDHIKFDDSGLGADMESEYNLFLKKLTEKNCLVKSLKTLVSLNMLMDHQMRQVVQILINYFQIQDKSFLEEIIYIIGTLDNKFFFRQNVGLYLISMEFLVYLDTAIPGIITDRNSILSFMLISMILVHKYYVDCPYTNHDICQWLKINLKHLNYYELFVLSKLQFKLPFTLFKICAVTGGQ